jgi:hypothetical protein
MVRQRATRGVWALAWLLAVGCGESSSRREGDEGAGGSAGKAGAEDSCPCPTGDPGSDPYVGPTACTFPPALPSCAETAHEELDVVAATDDGAIVFVGCDRTVIRVPLDSLNELSCEYASDGSFKAALRDDLGDDRKCENVLFWQTGELSESCNTQTRCWVGAGELPDDETPC